MKRVNNTNSSCRHCRFYRPEGRRGGACQKLNVPVESNWEACSLASSPFTSSLKELEKIIHLESTLSLKSPNRKTLKIHPKPIHPKPKETVGVTNNKIL